jgi:hypothetical protein
MSQDKQSYTSEEIEKIRNDSITIGMIIGGIFVGLSSIFIMVFI